MVGSVEVGGLESTKRCRVGGGEVDVGRCGSWVERPFAHPRVQFCNPPGNATRPHLLEPARVSQHADAAGSAPVRAY